MFHKNFLKTVINYVMLMCFWKPVRSSLSSNFLWHFTFLIVLDCFRYISQGIFSWHFCMLLDLELIFSILTSLKITCFPVGQSVGARYLYTQLDWNLASLRCNHNHNFNVFFLVGGGTSAYEAMLEQKRAGVDVNVNFFLCRWSRRKIRSVFRWEETNLSNICEHPYSCL